MGEFALRQSPDRPDVAEAWFERAIAYARAQDAKMWEFRAATSLAHLWHSQGKTAEARDLFAPVYGWFTEGFDTADLKEAKALLDELNDDAASIWCDGMIGYCEGMLSSEQLARDCKATKPIIQRRRPQIRAVVRNCYRRCEKYFEGRDEVE